MADDRLLPCPVYDASGEVWNELADRIGNIDYTPLLVYLIDNVPAVALPALADQFQVTSFEWRLAVNDLQQRELIKKAIERRRHCGTPYAIEKGMEILGLPGFVTEWFEYGGEPGYFRVVIDLFDRGMDDETLQLLEQMIVAYKNKRSWLEVIRIWLTSRGGYHYVVATTIGEAVTIYPWATTTMENHGPLSTSIGYQSLETVTVNPLPA